VVGAEMIYLNSHTTIEIYHFCTNKLNILLKWIFEKWNGRGWTGLIWFRIGTGGRDL